MNSTPGWVQRVMDDPESRQAYEREKLILSATEGIYAIMEEKGLTKAEVGRRLGTTRANIGQMLSGSRNMTLRSLADLAFACEARVLPDFQPVAAPKQWLTAILQLPPAGSSSASRSTSNTPPGDAPLAALSHAA